MTKSCTTAAVPGALIVRIRKYVLVALPAAASAPGSAFAAPPVITPGGYGADQSEPCEREHMQGEGARVFGAGGLYSVCAWP